MRKNQFEEALFKCEDDRYVTSLLDAVATSSLNTTLPHPSLLSSPLVLSPLLSSLISSSLPSCRFEIDMIIDTNMSAIRVLEPIAEEIASLRRW